MIYFVTPKWIKENTPIADNVDDKSIVPLIKSTADMWVRAYIGTYFYNDLLTKYNAQTLNADETVLVANYIKYIIGWRVCAEFAIDEAYKLTNKGPQTQSGDYSSNPEFKAITFVHHHYADMSSFYQNNITQYLIDNKNLFPEYISDLNKDSIIKKSDCSGDINTFNTNIIFI